MELRETSPVHLVSQFATLHLSITVFVHLELPKIFMINQIWIQRAKSSIFSPCIKQLTFDSEADESNGGVIHYSKNKNLLRNPRVRE